MLRREALIRQGVYLSKIPLMKLRIGRKVVFVRVRANIIRKPDAEETGEEKLSNSSGRRSV